MSELLFNAFATPNNEQNYSVNASKPTDSQIAFLHYPNAERPKVTTPEITAQQTILQAYKPLIILGATALVGGLIIALASETNFTHRWLGGAMGIFFVVLAVLKLLDLKAFVTSFARYDIIAKADRRYGYVYPFMELGLGCLYLWGYFESLVNLLTVCLMGASAVGVLIALKRGKQLDCACMGSRFKLKLSTVSLVETVGMGAMALLMLIT